MCAERGSGIFTLGGVQDITGHFSESSDQISPALNLQEEVGLGDLFSNINYSVNLSFYELLLL